MKIKPFIITALGLLVLLAVMCLTAYRGRAKSSLLLALPSEINSLKIGVYDIDEFTKNNFLVTYEIISPERINLSHTQFFVATVGTTSSYPQILKLPMISGSFFSLQAWEQKQRHAVFNEKAAFTVFGSNQIAGNQFRINNETWVVTGVIRDEYDNNGRVYIPSSVKGGSIEALAVMPGAFDETFIKNSLKTIGIREDIFDFINFDTRCKRLWEMAAVIILCFLALLFLAVFKRLVFLFIKTVKTLKTKQKNYYAMELIAKDKNLLFKAVFQAFGLTVLPVFSLFLIIKIITICLPWQDIPPIGKFHFNFFYAHLKTIYTLELISTVFFIVSLLAVALFFLIGYLNRAIKYNWRARP